MVICVNEFVMGIAGYLQGIYEVTSSHCWDKDPCGSQLHGWHPALDCKFQCSGAQRSHRSPMTLGRHGHCPVTLSQFPARLSQPYSLHSQPLTMVRKIPFSLSIAKPLRYIYSERKWNFLWSVPLLNRPMISRFDLLEHIRKQFTFRIPFRAVWRNLNGTKYDWNIKYFYISILSSVVTNKTHSLLTPASSCS